VCQFRHFGKLGPRTILTFAEMSCFLKRRRVISKVRVPTRWVGLSEGANPHTDKIVQLIKGAAGVAPGQVRCSRPHAQFQCWKMCVDCPYELGRGSLPTRSRSVQAFPWSAGPGTTIVERVKR